MGIFGGKQNWQGSKAPELRRGIWINSKPLTLKALRGKVVIVDFWEYSCINCVRTLPYLKEWYKRYHDLGLEIIGVHAPEFEFGKIKANVEQAMQKLGVVWPVVMDNDFLTWRAYNNSVWPRELLINQDGIVVHDQSGEGGYQETEKLIQELLKKDHPNTDFTQIMNPVRETDQPHKVCFRTSPELYAGTARGMLGNPEGYQMGNVVDYQEPSGELEVDKIYLSGKWQNNPEYLNPAMDGEGSPWLGLKYHAKGVYAVIKPQEQSGFKVWLTHDDKPVAKEAAGEDVKYEQGPGGVRSYIFVDEPRMYRLINNPEFGVHTVKLYPESKSFGFYTFTFESACQ